MSRPRVRDEEALQLLSQRRSHRRLKGIAANISTPAQNSAGVRVLKMLMVLRKDSPPPFIQFE